MSSRVFSPLSWILLASSLLVKQISLASGGFTTCFYIHSENALSYSTTCSDYEFSKFLCPASLLVINSKFKSLISSIYDHRLLEAAMSHPECFDTQIL